VGKWLEFFRWIATHRAFRKYILETQGDPETMDPNTPPFSSSQSEIPEKLDILEEVSVPVGK